MRLILASSSKNRQNIFKNIGWKYEVVKSTVEEYSEATEPREYVKDLSRDKANSVASQIEGQALIVAADSVVYMDGRIFRATGRELHQIGNAIGTAWRRRVYSLS